MWVRLVSPPASHGETVLFDAEAGRGEAVWRGPTRDTVAAIDVELDIPDEVGWDEIVLDAPGGDALSVGDEGMVVRGVVEGVDESGVVTLHLPGAWLLVDTSGDRPGAIVGHGIRFVARRAELYPTDI
jgi:hypothetical protein